MAWVPPMKFVDPTLTSESSSAFGGSIATRSTPALRKARERSGVISVVTASTPRQPFWATVRSQGSDSGRSPEVVPLACSFSTSTTMSTSISRAAVSTPRSTWIE